MLRLFGRACVRANLPVRQTQGFNPRPRLSLPLPRPVGIASDAERLLLELTAQLHPDEIAPRMTPHLPDGITLRQSALVNHPSRHLPRLARYCVPIPPDNADALARNAARLMRFQPIPYDRFIHKTSRHVRLDLRPFIDAIVISGHHARFDLLVTAGGSAKPAEICHLLGLGDQNVNHLIRRRQVEWLLS